MNIEEEIKKVMESDKGIEIKNRMKEFESLSKMPDKEWFSELCFCILTANSKASTGIAIQKHLGCKGFANLSQKELSNAIKNNKHRFHNKKSDYIIKARKYRDIKQILAGKSAEESREWLVKNIKGIGYKESSHFLRNVGEKNLAILDRHILNLMKENNLIDKIPNQMNKHNYLEIEEKFISMSKRTGLSPAELDLCMWCMKTGSVMK